MHHLLQDLRFAARQLIKHPGFSVVAAITLALGIGANTAVFSVLYGVLLRPLPYPESERIIGLTQHATGYDGEMGVTWRESQYLLEHSTAFQYLASGTSIGMNVVAGNQAEHVHGLRVTSDYFRVLGVAPALGRQFLAEDDVPGAAETVVLSDGLWQRRFGGDRGVIGRAVSIDGRPAVVIGVMPAGFESVPRAGLWATLAPVRTTVGSGQNLSMIGRLKPGVSLPQSNAMMAQLSPGYRAEFSRSVDSTMSVGVATERELLAGDVEGPVRILFGAIALVLLIACANVANLLLGRAATRGREIAVRVAVGATRTRLVRQLLTESMLLSLVGAVIGMVFASWMLQILLDLAPASLTGTATIQLDGRAALFATLVALGSGVLFGLMPALQASRADIHDTLREGASRATGTRRAGHFRSGLVIAEVALSLILLSGAGLLIRSVGNLTRVDPGFRPAGLVSAEIWLTGSQYKSPEATSAFYGELTRQLRGQPGVTSAAVVEAGLPLQRGGNIPIMVDGTQLRGTIDYRTVTPDYFATLGVPVKDGRTFGEADHAGGAPVVVVSQSFATKHLPGRAAIGRTIHVGGQGGVDAQIIGIVGDVHSFIGAPEVPTVFLVSPQTPAGFTQVFNGWYPIHVLVRLNGQTASIEAALPRLISGVDPLVPVGEVRSMERVLAQSIAFDWFVMMLLSVFGGLAVVLAAIGLYGVIAYLVTQRKHEIGVRVALGASTRDILGLVLGRGAVLSGVGAVLGIAGAMGLTRLLQNQLFGVEPTDPVTLGLATILMGTVALTASYLPARRAMRVDPVEALRAE